MDILAQKHMSYEEAIELIAEVENFDPRDFYTDGKPDIFKLVAQKKSNMIKSLVVDNEKKVVSIKIRGDYSGYVYLIRSASGFTKIGHTENLKKRFASIDMSSPEEISIYYSKVVRNRVNLERKLHSLFADKRTKGEWFLLSDEDLQEAKAVMDSSVDEK